MSSPLENRQAMRVATDDPFVIVNAKDEIWNAFLTQVGAASAGARAPDSRLMTDPE